MLYHYLVISSPLCIYGRTFHIYLLSTPTQFSVKSSLCQTAMLINCPHRLSFFHPSAMSLTLIEVLSSLNEYHRSKPHGTE